MKISFFFFTQTIIIFICSFCRGFAQPTNPVVLITTGESGSQIFLNYKNVYGDFKRVKFSEFTDKSNSKFSIAKVWSEQPIVLDFNANYNQYPVYAKPGDSIYISINQHGRYYSFNARGKADYRVKFFNLLDELGYGMGYPDFFNRIFKNSNYKNNVAFARKNYENRMRILNEQNAKYSLEPDFYDFMNTLIKEYYVRALLTPYIQPKQDNEHDSLPKIYKNIVSQSPLQSVLKNSKWINFSSHRATIISYIKSLNKDSINTENELSSMYHSAVDSLYGMEKDYALFFLMKNNIQQRDEKTIKFYKKFINDCKSIQYIHYIDSLYGRANDLTHRNEVLNILLEDPNGHFISWGDLIKFNKGKIIYIDFLASWCGPCIEQIPFSKQLEEVVREEKLPVSFVYFSIDSNKSKWMAMLKKENLITSQNKNYLLKSDTETTKYLDIPPIPKYVLIDKEGKFVSLDALSPNNPALLTELKSLSK